MVWYLRTWVLKLRQGWYARLCISIFTLGPFRLKGYCHCLRLSVCLCDNSTQIWAGITKFAPNMNHGILTIGIENEDHWPWPSRSFWPFWLRILGNLACLINNSSQIWAIITKFVPNMHPGILSAGIENGGHWPWHSRSFCHFYSRNSIQCCCCILI